MVLFTSRLFCSEWEGGCFQEAAEVTDDFAGESDDELRFEGEDGNAGLLALCLPRA